MSRKLQNFNSKRGQHLPQSLYITSSGVRLCWELEELKGPKGPTGWMLSRFLPRSSVQEGLMWSERKHGLLTEPVPVSAYVGSSEKLKDLKDGDSRMVLRRAENLRPHL
jgi:hypothetical protein